MAGLKVHNEESCDGVIYFELEGGLDSHNFETIETLFKRHFDSDTYRFVIDLKQLEDVSSAGAGVFIGAAGTCQNNDGNIVVLKPSQKVKEIFELLGICQIFPIVNNREQAVGCFTRKTL